MQAASVEVYKGQANPAMIGDTYVSQAQVTAVVIRRTAYLE